MSVKIKDIKGVLIKPIECFCDYTKPEKCRACKAIDQIVEKSLGLNREKLYEIILKVYRQKSHSTGCLKAYLNAIIAKESEIIEVKE